MNLTDEQTRAIEAGGRLTTLVATAGSGKTTVLVGRYMRHVDEGLSPSQILTITFTRKSAAEMKKRIVRKLREQGKPREAQEAETGPVQTVHGFCERILRENAFAAGVSPKFEVVEGKVQNRMADRAVIEAIEVSATISEEAESAVSRMALTPLFNKEPTAHGLIRKTVSQLLGQARAAGLSQERLAEMARSPDALMEAFEHYRTEVPHEKLPKADDRGADPAEEIAALSVGIGGLTVAAWRALDRAMADEHVLDFAALEDRAVRLVESDPHVANRLRDQYKVLLVDESQDLNPTQYRLLKALDIEQSLFIGDPQQSIYGFRHADRELFMRHSERGVVLRLGTNHRSASGVLNAVEAVFTEKWPGFAPPKDGGQSTWNGPAVEIWPVNGKEWRKVARCAKGLYTETPHDASIGCLVRTKNIGSNVAHEMRAEDIPVEVMSAASSIYGILPVRDVANSLEALADPTNDLAHLAMLKSPIVGLSWEAIVQLGLAKPVRDALQTAHFGSSGDQEALDRFNEWFWPMAKIADRVSAWEILAPMLDASGAWARYAREAQGAQTVANLRKLSELAVQEPSLDPRGFAAEIRELEQMELEESEATTADPDKKAIQVLTVHKSKGLEWDAVIVAISQFSTRKTESLMFDSKAGLFAFWENPTRSPYHRLLQGMKAESEEEENDRLMYVAMTRARRRLCLVIDPNDKRDKWSKALVSILGYPHKLPHWCTVRDPDEEPER